MSQPDILWQGKLGKKYGYWIRPIYTNWKDMPGNYIYAKETSPRKWSAIYIGQTSSLSKRLADHEKEAEAIERGATHIHAHTSSADEIVRCDEEIDLISKWKPVCNDRL